MSRLRIPIGLAVSVAFITLLLGQVDRDEVADAVRGIDLAWMVVALALFAAGIAVRALRWRAILRPICDVPLSEATSLMVIGLAANNVLPARTGEIVRAVLLKRRRGVSGLAVLGTIFVERVLDGLVLALFLAAAIAFAGGTAPLRLFAALVGGGFLALTALLALVSMRPRTGDRLTEVALRLAPARIRVRAAGWADRFRTGLAPMATTRAWGVVMSLTVLSWSLEALSAWAVGQAFGLGLHPGIYFGVCGAANLSMAAPSTSGGIGPYEYFAREVVVRAGVPVATGTAFAIVLHLSVLLPVAVAGLVLLWVHGLGLRTLAVRIDEVSDGPPEGSPLPARLDGDG
ncbi:MAG: lysylphosphatidylglycerol synthase transmembrane domain-containing protein [Chloroflexi bacterium]|nr:lysylphosphatidylglycerol synthase transmembrane domain-containing protein [Chloroflexota bacterium]